MHVADNHGESPQRSALVLYGSETGNAQDVAEELGQILERLHFTARVTDLNDVGLVRSYMKSQLLFDSSNTLADSNVPSFRKSCSSTNLLS